jgi:hypothetical protein
VKEEEAFIVHFERKKRKRFLEKREGRVHH